MNDIIKPLTKDGMVGWDSYNQLWLWRLEKSGNRSGTIIADVREKVCPICNHGWEITAESLGDQHYMMSREEWTHESCFIRYLSLQEYDFWCDALVGAGFIFGRIENEKRLPSLEAIPNQYWPQGDPWGAGQPWYRVHLLKKMEDHYTNTAHGRLLKLGSRKRVYVLEVEPGEGSYDQALAEKLFAPEDVTKRIRPDGMMVHAWGRDKAREYLKHFSEILGVAEMRRRMAAART